MAKKKVGNASRSGTYLVMEDWRLEDIERGMEKAVGAVARRAAEAAELRAKSNHQGWENDTWNTQNNTQGETAQTESGSGVAVSVGTTTYYAEYLEERYGWLAAALEYAFIDIEGQLRAELRRQTK